MSSFGSNKTLKPVDCSEVEDLIIYGSSKLDMELEAAKANGIHNIDYELLDSKNVPDEVLAEHYDHNNLY